MKQLSLVALIVALTASVAAADDIQLTNGRKLSGKVVKKVAKTLLGRIAQVSAQLVLDSGVLGAPPKRRPAKKRARKA